MCHWTEIITNRKVNKYVYGKECARANKIIIVIIIIIYQEK